MLWCSNFSYLYQNSHILSVRTNIWVAVCFFTWTVSLQIWYKFECILSARMFLHNFLIIKFTLVNLTYPCQIPLFPLVHIFFCALFLCHWLVYSLVTMNLINIFLNAVQWSWQAPSSGAQREVAEHVPSWSPSTKELLAKLCILSIYISTCTFILLYMIIDNNQLLSCEVHFV